MGLVNYSGLYECMTREIRKILDSQRQEVECELHVCQGSRDYLAQQIEGWTPSFGFDRLRLKSMLETINSLLAVLQHQRRNIILLTEALDDG